MKEVLTREQSDKLFELGIPHHYATSICEVYECKTGNLSFNRYFSAMDLLRLIPKTITVNGFTVDLIIEFEEDGVHAYYYAISGSDGYAEEFVDALYKLTVFCIKHKHINPKQL